MENTAALFMKHYDPGPMLSGEAGEKILKNKTCTAITWRDQMRDPVYQFVVLVAGMTRKPVFDFIHDDRHSDGTLMREYAVGDYDEYLKEKNKELKTYADLLNNKDKKGASEAAWNKLKYAEIEQDIALVKQKRKDELEHHVPASMKSKQKCSLMNFMDACYPEKRQTTKKKDQVQPTQANIQYTTACTPVPERRSLFYSNETYFMPEFQAAVLSALQKVQARCTAVKLTLNTLMKESKYKVLFARLTAIQVLISMANNTRGEYKGVIAYRRLVMQENSVIARFKTLTGSWNSGGGDLSGFFFDF